MGKQLGKQNVGSPRRRWEDNNNMDLTEISCEDRRWIELAQVRVQCRALVLAVLKL